MPSEETQNVLDFILEQRGIDDFEKFSTYSLNHLHSPWKLHDIDKAIDAIINAFKNNEKIFIHGDFDVDGVTATTIMWRFLYQKLKANAIPYIPSRFEEGYGLSRDSLDAIVQQGGQLVITVDCGVKDIDLITEYSDKLKFVITDHHSLALKDNYLNRDDVEIIGDFAISKKALAVVHPALGNYPFDKLCGASVAWKLCCAINEKLNLGCEMSDFLDLVALATVCDIMPLIDENRALVKIGLEQFRKTKNVGLIALAEVSGIDISKVDEYSLGYQIGPRINAAGRLEHAIDAVKLLSTDKFQSARSIAKYLQTLNSKRQNLTQEYYEHAEEQIKDQIDDFVYYVEGENWPEGVVGLIAGKLSQKHSRPVLVASKKGSTIKGSARSIECFDIAQMFKKLDKLLIAHGGHTQAAGFTLSEENKDNFVTTLKKLANEYLNPDDLTKYLTIDALTTPKFINNELIQKIDLLSPFGFGNPKPVIAIENAEITNVRTFGKENNHCEITLFKDNHTINAVAFNQTIEKNRKKYISVAGTLKIDEYKKLPTIRLIDVKFS